MITICLSKDIYFKNFFAIIADLLFYNLRLIRISINSNRPDTERSRSIIPPPGSPPADFVPALPGLWHAGTAFRNFYSLYK